MKLTKEQQSFISSLPQEKRNEAERIIKKFKSMGVAVPTGIIKSKLLEDKK